MFGRYIESELDKARDGVKAKDAKKIERVVEARLRAILHPPSNEPGKEEIPQPVPKGKYRDPMTILGKQG